MRRNGILCPENRVLYSRWFLLGRLRLIRREANLERINFRTHDEFPFFSLCNEIIVIKTGILPRIDLKML